MKNVIAVTERSDGRNMIGTIFFDCRQEMPTIEEVSKIAKEYFKNIPKGQQIILPAMNYKGEYESNDFIYIIPSNEKYENKVVYVNEELAKDFRKNPINIWKEEQL